MVTLKGTIAAVIVCFKPHVFLTLCILLVIIHSIVIAIEQGTSNNWRIGNQYDLTLTMTTLVLIVALIWAAFFLFMVRFELRNELESLLMLFQCSKRGLRFLGVVGFHALLLILVTTIVSLAVEKSIPVRSVVPLEARYHVKHLDNLKNNRSIDTHAEMSKGSQKAIEKISNHSELKGRLRYINDKFRQRPQKSSEDQGYGRSDRDYMLVVYKIWLTAIVYAFLYLLLENAVMFYSDMSLVEFVHYIFLRIVVRTTGIDLSDYSAGEMLFNPLVDRRVR